MASRHDSPIQQGDDNKIRVAIVGGGIGGLCLAAGLIKQRHIDVHVYESVPSYKDVGAGLALHLNALKAMDLIGPQVKQAYFSRALAMASEAELEISTTVSLASGPNAGAVVAELGAAKGRKTIARSDLLAALLELIPPSSLSFGKRLAAISEDDDSSSSSGSGDAAAAITLSFRDGTTARADCLIGSDGVHSTVRAHLLGASHPAARPVNRDGWRVYRTLIPAALAATLIPAQYTRSVPIMCGAQGHINCMPLHQGRDVSAGVAVRGGADREPGLRMDDYGAYTPDARAIVAMVARDTSASWDVMDHDHAPTYARRKTCIMGDAAHASLPFAGQGAAQAIEDAAVLTALFAEVGRNINTDVGLDSAVTLDLDGSRDGSGGNGKACVEAVLKAYDQVRRPRSQRVVEIARDFGKLYAYAMPGYGDDPVKMKGFFKEAAAFTNNADVAAQNRDAVEALRQLLK